jgi:hypothetical protein
MTANRLNQVRAAELIAQGFVAVVYAAYDYADKQRGDLISKHKTYEAANHKASENTMWGVRFLSDVIGGAKAEG